MANDHAQNSLSPSLRPRTEITSRPTGGVLVPADDVASTQAGFSLERHAAIDRSCEAGRRVECAIHHLVRRGPSTVPTAHDPTRRT